MSSAITTIRSASCTHEGNRHGDSVPLESWSTPPGLNSPVQRVTVWCSECSADLYTQNRQLDLTVTTTFKDEVYRLLYTRLGRKELLIELMKEQGLSVPERWEEP